MLLGIDVGGTFTDAVLIRDRAVVAQGKSTTTHEAVLKGILASLDKVLAKAEPAEIERVVISSTIVTNALTEHKTDPVYLAVMPGPGMNIAHSFPVEPHILQGYVDHRGKVVARPNLEALKKEAGVKAAAASGKFAVRNPENEQALGRYLTGLGYKRVFCGSRLSGELNFVRRTNAAYFAAAVADTFQEFCGQVQQSLLERNIAAPVQILKADGGTLPLEAALLAPEESIFTGPAASVLGIMALTPPSENSISLDVGGTTTDIAFWEGGKPLMAKHGATVDGYATSVRAFHMRSVGIGGDSVVRRTNGAFSVGPERVGPAMALGGHSPALSDALIALGAVGYGDYEKAAAAMASFALEGEGVAQVATKVVEAALEVIEGAIRDMLQEWSLQPVYTVDDVIRGTEFIPQAIIGVGGGAPGLIELLGKRLQLPVHIPVGALVANAVGAALARPTLGASLRADTTEGYYLIPESGERKRLPSGFSQAKARELLTAWLNAKGAQLGLPKEPVEIVAQEFFHTLHGYYDVGEIIYLQMQLEPGIMYPIQGREVEL